MWIVNSAILERILAAPGEAPLAGPPPQAQNPSYSLSFFHFLLMAAAPFVLPTSLVTGLERGRVKVASYYCLALKKRIGICGIDSKWPATDICIELLLSHGLENTS